MSAHAYAASHMPTAADPSARMPGRAMVPPDYVLPNLLRATAQHAWRPVRMHAQNAPGGV